MGGYDVIHFHNDVDLSFPFFSRLVDKPKIFHFHCLNLTYDFFKRNFVARHILKNIADIYIVVSKFLVRMVTDLGISEKAVRVVHNGVDINEFIPQRSAKKENLLLFVGRLDVAKGLHILLKALNYLTTPVSLWVVGSSMDPRYYTKILILAKKVNEKNIHKVTFMGAQQPHEMLKLFQKASISVQPSLSEALSMAILESLSCETPVVASNVGGIPDIIRDHENGILVPPNDPVKLAEGIQYLLDNVEIRRKLGKEGRRLIVEEFSSKVMAERLCWIYREILI